MACSGDLTRVSRCGSETGNDGGRLWCCCGVFDFMLSMMLCAFLVLLCGFLEIVVVPERNSMLSGVFAYNFNFIFWG